MSAKILDFFTGKPLEKGKKTAIIAKNAQKWRKKEEKGGETPVSFTEKSRRALLAKVHVAKKQLGMTEEEYRGMLNGNFKVDSAADLTVRQLEEMVRMMRKAGFKPLKGHARRGQSRRNVPAALTASRKDILQPLLRKIEAQLAEKGRVEGTDVPWGYALAILKRQSKGEITTFEEADTEALRGVITALTRDAVRHGRYAGAWGTALHDLNVD